MARAGARSIQLSSGSSWLGWGVISALALVACNGEAPAEDQKRVSAFAVGDANVITQHNDFARTGAQRAESTLTPTSVNYNDFGVVYTRAVNGMIFAQPLYVEDALKRYVYVVTSENMLYALDANNEAVDPTQGLAITRQISPPALRSAFPNAGGGFLEGTTNVGVLSTPAIVTATHTLYVVAPDGSGGGVKWRLHAFDANTLLPKYTAQSSIEITGSVVGIGGLAPGRSMTLTFNPARQISRAGLLAMQQNTTTRIYAGFAGFGDAPPYHGWIFKFIDNNCTPVASCQGLSISAVRNTTPHEVFESGDAGRPEGGGGIWQSGNGIAGDNVNNLIYFTTGNATPRAGSPFTTPYGADSIDNGVAQLNSLTLAINRTWLPPNYGTLQISDTDFGSGGVLLLPGNKLLAAGKTGVFYVANRDLASGPTQAFQAFDNTWVPPLTPTSMPCTTGGSVSCPTTYDNQAGPPPNVHGTPVYWEGTVGSSSVKRIYAWAEKDYLKYWNYDPTTGVVNTTAHPAPVRALQGMPGGVLSISSNGSSNAVIWATVPETDARRCLAPGCDANQRRAPGRIYAFDANLNPLWDAYIPGHAKFTPPTIAAGRVFVPTFSNRLIVYGPKPQTVSTWRSLAGPTKTSFSFNPGLSTWDGTRMDIFMRSTGSQMFHKAWVSSSWLPTADWEAHPGATIAGALASASWGVGRVDVLGREGSSIKWKFWEGTWSAWDGAGHLPTGSAASDPSLVTWASGRLDAFALNSSGDLLHSAYVSGAWTSPWEVHTTLSGPHPEPGSRLAVVATSDAATPPPGVRHWTTGQSLHVFARGQVSAFFPLLYKRYTTARGWEPVNGTSWFSLGGSLASDPSAVSAGDGKIDVFVRNGDGELSHAYTANATSANPIASVPWNPWEGRDPIGAPQPEFSWMVTSPSTRPVVLTDGNGTIALYVRGGDDVMHRCLFNGSYWSLWQKLRGGSAASEPIGIRTGSDEIFTGNASGDLWQIEPPSAAPP